jgi:hypothetical protein
MNGIVLTYYPLQSDVAVMEMDRPLTPEMLRAAVGCPYPQRVPYFDTIEYNGAIHDCIAFVPFLDAEFPPPQSDLDQPLNEVALGLWDAAFRRSKHPDPIIAHLISKGRRVDDVSSGPIYGPVLVVFGDKEFVQAASELGLAIMREGKREEAHTILLETMEQYGPSTQKHWGADTMTTKPTTKTNHPPRRLPNSASRTREHLLPDEVDRLLKDPIRASAVPAPTPKAAAAASMMSVLRIIAFLLFD